MRCTNGRWSYVARCIPELGTVTSSGEPQIAGGVSARHGEAPWHEGIYSGGVSARRPDMHASTLAEYRRGALACRHLLRRSIGEALRSALACRHLLRRSIGKARRGALACKHLLQGRPVPSDLRKLFDQHWRCFIGLRMLTCQLVTAAEWRTCRTT